MKLKLGGKMLRDFYEMDARFEKRPPIMRLGWRFFRLPFILAAHVGLLTAAFMFGGMFFKIAFELRPFLTHGFFLAAVFAAFLAVQSLSGWFGFAMYRYCRFESVIAIDFLCALIGSVFASCVWAWVLFVG